MTTTNGSAYDSMDYLPFGEQVAGGTGSSHKFTGYERDSESGVDYAMARTMNSSLGRFMSPDPWGGDRRNSQTLNRYTYAANNPLRFVDPRGMDLQEPADPGSDCGDQCGAGGTLTDELLVFSLP